MVTTKSFTRADAVKRSRPVVDYYGSVRVHGFGVEGRDGDYALTCPNCGFGYMHHRAVMVYGRGEDEELIENDVSDTN